MGTEAAGAATATTTTTIVVDAVLVVTVHSLSISLGDQLPDWNVAARYGGHCGAAAARLTSCAVDVPVPVDIVAIRNRRIVVELLGTPGLFIPRFTWREETNNININDY